MAKVFLRAGKIGLAVIIPLVVLGIILFAINVFSVAQTGIPDTGSDVPIEVQQLRQEAATFVAGKLPDLAQQCYEDIIAGFPGTEYALDAQSQIIANHIKNGELPAAEAALTHMLSTYSGLTENVDDEMFEIILAYYSIEHYQQVIEYCQYMLTQWPNSSKSMWVVSRQAQACIMQRNLAEPERLIDILKSNYSDEKYFGAVLCNDIANAYIEKGYRDKALSLWQDVSSEFPAEPISKLKLASYYIKQKDVVSASAQIDEVFALVNAENDLAEELRKFAMKARAAKQYDLEQSIYDRLLQQFPDHERAMPILSSKASGSLAKGDYLLAGECVDALFADYSTYPGFVKNLYELASRKARAAKQYELEQSIYDRLLQHFPDHERAMPFLSSKASMCLTKGDYLQAGECVDALFANYTTHPDFVKNLYGLARMKARSAKQYDLEQSIYDRLLQQFPDHERAMPILSSKASGCLSKGDYLQAGECVDALFADYTTHPGFVKNLLELASRKATAAEQYDLEQSIHVRLLQQFPDHHFAPRVLTSGIKRRIQLNDMAAAEEKTEELFAKYSHVPAFVDSVLSICKSFIRQNDPAMALQYINRALQAFPNHAKAVLLLETKTDCYLEMGDDKQFEAVVNDITQNYSESKDFAVALRGIADSYRKNGNHAKGIELYQHVIDNSPQTTAAMASQAGIALSHFSLGNHDKVEVAYDKLLADYKGLRRYSHYSFIVPEEYYYLAKNALIQGNREVGRANGAMAVKLWEAVDVNDLGEYHKQATIFFLGVSSGFAGNKNAAFENMQKVLADYPNSEYARSALYRTTLYARSLMRDPARNPEAESLYEQNLTEYVEKYPDKIYSSECLRKLGEFYYRKARHAEALSRFEQLIEKDDKEFGKVVKKMSECYRQLGSPETAEEVLASYQETSNK